MPTSVWCHKWIYKSAAITVIVKPVIIWIMLATIGHAQKVWTIFAKHLWCHDALGDSGLCPVDRVMRDITVKELLTNFPNSKAKLLARNIEGQAWTSMTRSTYFDLLGADLFCASSLGISVSVWELDRFSGGRGLTA